MGEPARVPVRELRNHVSEVLRRVEAGETLEVTVNDRPVALMTPRQTRRSTLPTQEFFATLPQADSGLRHQLDEALDETTDDLADPWLE
ncbi:type II toxin-antitoxin system Phd/YefM family antitoxin [Jiangella gansuensis]|uniref:type II toxin-antitoxin system Phd/YefM family antitoxin n=1 Tax=Jiangella gansuensis TaxID=281473 RepID=UPI0009FF44A8|nr:type II toxin-antitoxin system prevent-host-death family antitoxin [Jiangella gansuensis]